MAGAISFDLVMEADMQFVEGTFRLDDGAWQVFIASKSAISGPELKRSQWPSGVGGLTISVPNTHVLNKKYIEAVLGTWSGVDEWHEVKGPDSMQLR